MADAGHQKQGGMDGKALDYYAEDDHKFSKGSMVVGGKKVFFLSIPRLSSHLHRRRASRH